MGRFRQVDAKPDLQSHILAGIYSGVRRIQRLALIPFVRRECQPFLANWMVAFLGE